MRNRAGEHDGTDRLNATTLSADEPPPIHKYTVASASILLSLPTEPRYSQVNRCSVNSGVRGCEGVSKMSGITRALWMIDVEVVVCVD